jgi:hypothetical protein
VPTVSESSSAWPAAAKLSSSASRPVLRPAQPGPAGPDPVLLEVPAGQYLPVVPDWLAAGQHAGLAEAEADPGPDGLPQRRRQLVLAAVGDPEQVEQRVLLEEPAVPARPRMRDRGEGPETLGQAGGLRVDHPGGDVVPVGVAGLLAGGQALPHLVAEPPVELGQAGRHPGLTLLGAAGRGPGVLGFGRLAGWQPGWPGRPGR